MSPTESGFPEPFRVSSLFQGIRNTGTGTMASIQSIDQFFALANALLLKLRLAESYATRSYELMAGHTQARLVERRKALDELKTDIDKNLNDLQNTCNNLERAFVGTLTELDRYQPTGYVISFGALKRATADVSAWVDQTLAWLPTSNKIQARLTLPLIRKCDEIADGFPFAPTQEAKIRKQLWHEQTVLTNRAELTGIENQSGQPGHSKNKTPPEDVQEIARMMKLKRWQGKQPIELCRAYIRAKHKNASDEFIETQSQNLKRKRNRY